MKHESVSFEESSSKEHSITALRSRLSRLEMSQKRLQMEMAALKRVVQESSYQPVSYFNRGIQQKISQRPQGDRLAFFLDIDNIWFDFIREGKGRAVNFLEIPRVVARGWEYQCHAYLSVDPDHQSSEMEDIWRQSGWHVRQKTRTYYSDGSCKGNLDMELAVDAIFRCVDTYDTAVLVSKDGDFADLLMALREMGKRVEIAMFGEFSNVNAHLLRAADSYIDLSNHWDRLEYRKKSIA